MKQKYKIYDVLHLDYTDISDVAVDQIKNVLTKVGLYLGNVEEELGCGPSSTYVIYISNRKLTKKELLKEFPDYK